MTELNNENMQNAAEKNDDRDVIETGKPEKPEGEAISFKSVLSEVFDWVEIFVMSTAFVIILFAFFARLTIVRGPSMQDTLFERDYLVVSDLFYEPKAHDIVVCHDLSTGYTEPIVKRVIATEGQRVSIDFETWTVTVDGEIIDESEYRKLAADSRVTSDWMASGEEYTVPEGHVFVMGDNRNHSADSRTSDISFIDKRCIVGKALVRILPADRFSVFS